MSKWKLMNSAPKDGSNILGFEPAGEWTDDVDGWVGPMFWTDDEGWMAELLAEGRAEYPGCYAALPCKPVRWMPLPEPPRPPYKW